jgi:uncharacterized protein with HEPN domain
VNPPERPLDDRARQALRDIVEFAELAIDLVSRGRAAYDDDVQLRLAAEAIVHRVGEATSRVPEHVVSAHPEIAFRSAKAMRNVVAHQYHRVNPATMWRTIEAAIPALAMDVQRLLGEEDESEDISARD